MLRHTPLRGQHFVEVQRQHEVKHEIEKQKKPTHYTSGLVDEHPVFIFGKTAYLLPKTFSWALQSSSLPQEYIAAKAIKKCRSEKPILYHPAAGLVVFDYVGSDILACSVLGFKDGKFTFPFSSDGYNLTARINPDNTLSIKGTRPSYLCGAFITPFEYVYSDKNAEAVLLPPIQQSFTTSTHITYALEIENKTGTPYKITLPENTKVTITKYINTPNCFFIESELGSGWIYHQPLENENNFYYGELCQHFCVAIGCESVLCIEDHRDEPERGDHRTVVQVERLAHALVRQVRQIENHAVLLHHAEQGAAVVSQRTIRAGADGVLVLPVVHEVDHAQPAVKPRRRIVGAGLALVLLWLLLFLANNI